MSIWKQANLYKRLAITIKYYAFLANFRSTFLFFAKPLECCLQTPQECLQSLAFFLQILCQSESDHYQRRVLEILRKKGGKTFWQSHLNDNRQRQFPAWKKLKISEERQTGIDLQVKKYLPIPRFDKSKNSAVWRGPPAFALNSWKITIKINLFREYWYIWFKHKFYSYNNLIYRIPVE